MSTHKQIEVNGNLISVALKPCPWCKKTPHLLMPLDQEQDKFDEKTWIWKIFCRCVIDLECNVSIRNTTKTDLARFLDKIDEWFNKWNENNPIKAYEKKILDLREIPNLGVK